jgi:hypothetical protein
VSELSEAIEGGITLVAGGFIALLFASAVDIGGFLNLPLWGFVALTAGAFVFVTMSAIGIGVFLARYVTLWEYLSTNENVAVPSEAILNVLRRNDGLVMGTSDIADVIGMSGQGAQNRLEDLEEADRIISQNIGGNLVWGLDPNERQEPVLPEIDRLIHAFEHIRSALKPTKYLGGVILAVGFALMFAGVTGIIGSTPTTVSNGWLIGYGYAAAAAGGVLWFVGGAVIYGLIVTEQTLMWWLAKRDVAVVEEGTLMTSSRRGRADPQLLLGLFVLALVAGPLIGTVTDLYIALANSPVFSPMLALFVTVCIVVAIVATIFQRG